MLVAVLGRCMPSEKSSFGKFEFEQARALQNVGGLDVVYCFSDNRSVKVHRKFALSVTEHEGVRVVGSWFPVGGLPWSVFDALRYRSQKRMFNEVVKLVGKPDVVYAHFPAMTLSTRLIEKLELEGIPLVCLEHWTKVKNMAIPKERVALLADAVSHSTSFMCVSDDLADSVSELTGANRDRIEVMPNMVRSDIFHPVSGSSDERPNGLSQRTVFISAGRLTDVKRFDLLFEAFGRVVQACDCELWIAGKGPEERKLRSLAQQLGISDRVSFLGWVDSTRMAELLSESDCYVSASSDETFGVPFAEAWMCGTFCIGADNNPLRHFFDGKRGALFTKDDVESLVQAMESMMHVNMEESSAIARWAADRFSEETVVARLVDKLNAVCE